MTPKQKTMSEICDILSEQAKSEGMGLDRAMFSKRHMQFSHKFLREVLENLKKPIMSDDYQGEVSE
jgi:hypothetical protein